MPACIEKKLTLSGATHLFHCQLLHWQPDFGILKYVIDRSYRVSSIHLEPGDITIALYWVNRPYTLYVWHLSGNRRIYYFNIADTISLAPAEFIWRDLVVDVLIDDDRRVHVLDEDELPSDLSPQLGSFIDAAKKAVIKDYPQIIEDAEAVIRQFL